MTEVSRLHHRDSFLNKLTQKLGSERLSKPAPFALSKARQHEVLHDASSDQLQEAFIEYAQSRLGVYTYVTLPSSLMDTIKRDCLAHFADHQGTVLVSQDSRLTHMFSSSPLTEQGFKVANWQSKASRSEQIAVAEQAQVGIVFVEQALVESGTVILQSSEAQGRAISLLPEHSIFIIRKSTLRPRATQACEWLHQRVQQGERLASCINFISGPSSTADIELIKVVGVHGPISASYIIIEDE